ncbi:hypothetical protein EDB86DRAFT_2826222 [Lactarius hatsudake]|nr:hypothetical protein EDB86DRAFT_2826222 [Lactarius hatsudake]
MTAWIRHAVHVNPGATEVWLKWRLASSSDDSNYRCANGHTTSRRVVTCVNARLRPYVIALDIAANWDVAETESDRKKVIRRSNEPMVVAVGSAAILVKVVASLGFGTRIWQLEPKIKEKAAPDYEVYNNQLGRSQAYHTSRILAEAFAVGVFNFGWLRAQRLAPRIEIEI